MSPAERNRTAALMWQQAMGTKDKQADESGSSAWIIPLLVNAHHYETEHTHYEGTRVQVNIHVIAVKQLLGKIRSVITGLKIKWEFFIIEATCYSTNGGGERSINEGGQWTDGKTTTENFSLRQQLH